MGWTQSEVGKVYGVNHATISVIVKNISNEISNIQAQYSKKKSVEDIAASVSAQVPLDKMVSDVLPNFEELQKSAKNSYFKHGRRRF